MLSYVVCTIFACIQAFDVLALPVHDAVENTELVFAFMIHRHGDRTPDSERNTIFSDNPKALQEASKPHGYGQLINVGKQRAFALGQFIRKRYGELLSPKFNSSEIYIRSTDYTRTQMTALSVMAAVYPSVEPRWHNNINWEPVPYTVVPSEYDPIQPLLNCPVLMSKVTSTFLSSPESMVPYYPLLQEVSRLLGYDEAALERIPVAVYAVKDLLDSQVSLGVPVSPELEALRPQLAEAAGVAAQEMFGDKDYFDLHSGPLIRDFLDYSAKVIAGEDTQKVRVYSAHDATVYSIQAALQLKPNQGVPPYAAMLSLELRKNIKTGDYSVLPVYLASPGKEPTYLQVEGCSDTLCSYDVFHRITSPIALDEDSWRSKCDWKKGFQIDSIEITKNILLK